MSEYAFYFFLTVLVFITTKMNWQRTYKQWLKKIIAESPIQRKTFDVGNVNGMRMKYPAKFKGSDSAVAFYRINTALANSVIKDSGFEVLEFLPHSAICVVTCLRYTETSCGPYNEMSFAFFVRPSDSCGSSSNRWRIPYLSNWIDVATCKASSYVFFLPVSQSQSVACGQKMWGFPKILADIRFSRDEKSETFCYSLLNANGDKQIAFKANGNGMLRTPIMDNIICSKMDRKMHASILSVSYSGVRVVGSCCELQIDPDTPEDHVLKRLCFPRECLFSASMSNFELQMSAPGQI